MTFLFVLFCITFSLMLFPVLLGYYSRKAQRQEPLLIKSDNVKDPRYFSKSFRRMVETSLKDHPGEETLHLSKDERLLYADQQTFKPDQQIDLIVLAMNAPLNVPAGCKFSKEIYSAHDVQIGANTQIRALAGLNDITLACGVELLRWVDAESELDIGRYCHLGINASAGRRLRIGTSCSFQRLYAPEIVIGKNIGVTVGSPVGTMPKKQEVSAKLIHIDRVSSNETIAGSIIADSNLVLDENCVIHGSIHAGKRLHIRRGAYISGNVISDGDILIEENVSIEGDVFAQGCILVGYQCRIGSEGRIKSIVARKHVSLTEESIIFGYVGTEARGSIIDKDEFYEAMGSMF